MAATYSQAQSDLGPYVERLQRCIREAIRAFLSEMAPQLHKLEQRTQANIIRDFIVDSIRREFPDGEPGISHTVKRNLYLLNIRNLYLLRFKKLDRRHRTRNHPTQLSLDYLLQRPLELFPDLRPATHLNVGYLPGMTLASSSVWIVCPNGDVLDWKWELTAQNEPVQLVPTAARANRAPRVRPKVQPSAFGAEADG